MALSTRDLIYKFIADSDGDRVGGMSLVAIFLSEYRARSAHEAEELLRGLGDILENDTGTRLAACAWLVEALAANNVYSSAVEAKLRRRLASMKAKLDLPNEAETQVITALGKADLAIDSARKRCDSED